MSMTMSERRELIAKLNGRWWKLSQMLPDPAERGEFIWEALADGSLEGIEVLQHLSESVATHGDVPLALKFIENLDLSPYGSYLDNPGWNHTVGPLLGRLLQRDHQAVMNSDLDEDKLTLAELWAFAEGGLTADQVSEKAKQQLIRAWLVTEWDERLVSQGRALFPDEEQWAQKVLEALEQPEVTEVAWSRVATVLDRATAEQRVTALAKLRTEVAHRVTDALGDPGAEHVEPLERNLKRLEREQKQRYVSENLDALTAALVLARRAADLELPPELIERLTVALKRPAIETVNILGQALEALDEQARGSLIRDILAAGPPARAPIYAVMSTAGDEATMSAGLEAILTRFTKPTLGAKSTARRGLVGFGEPVVAPICERLGEITSPALLEVMLEVLGTVGSPAAAPTLVEQLGAKRKPLREAAEAGLKSLGEGAREALEAGLKAKKKAVREACGRLLGALEASADSPLTEAEAALEQTDTSALDATLKELETSTTYRGDDHQKLQAYYEELGSALLVRARDWLLENPTHWLRVDTIVPLLRALKDDPLAPWVVVDVISKLPKLRRWQGQGLLHLLSEQKRKAVEPLVQVLRQTSPQQAEKMYRHLLEHSKKPDRRALLNGLKSSQKGARAAALEGLVRWGDEAIDDLLPLLAAKKKDLRLAAATFFSQVPAPGAKKKLEAALKKETSEEVVTALEQALSQAGGEVFAAPEEVSTDESEVEALLEKQAKGKFPSFLDPKALPEVKLKSGQTLSDKAVHGLLTRLSKEGPDNQDELVRTLRPHLDDESAAALAVAIKAAWAKRGAKAKLKWAVFQQAVLADERRLDEVGPKLDVLASTGSHHQARWYLDVMARHGSVTGASWVLHWAKSSERRSVRQSAQDHLEALAKAAGTSIEAYSATLNAYIADDVADRNVPTLGFEAGPMKVDFGERVFAVKLDQNVGLVIQDTDSLKTYKTLPKPRKNESAGDAPKKVKELKQRLSATVKSLSARLEGGMISGRPWSAPAFRQLFLGHPIITRFASRLVFRATSGASTLLFTTSDEGLVDTEWEAVTLPDDAVVKLVHRMEMSDDELARWSQFFSDNEVIQPFRQLDRPVFTREEHPLPESGPLGTVARGTLVGRLQRLGWRNGPAEDAGMVYLAHRLLPGRGVRADISHGGFYIGGVAWDADEEIDLESVTFSNLMGKKLNKVDPIAYSEIRYDIQRMLE